MKKLSIIFIISFLFICTVCAETKTKTIRNLLLQANDNIETHMANNGNDDSLIEARENIKQVLVQLGETFDAERRIANQFFSCTAAKSDAKAIAKNDCFTSGFTKCEVTQTWTSSCNEWVSACCIGHARVKGTME